MWRWVSMKLSRGERIKPRRHQEGWADKLKIKDNQHIANKTDWSRTYLNVSMGLSSPCMVIWSKQMPTPSTKTYGRQSGYWKTISTLPMRWTETELTWIWAWGYRAHAWSHDPSRCQRHPQRPTEGDQDIGAYLIHLILILDSGHPTNEWPANANARQRKAELCIEGKQCHTVALRGPDKDLTCRKPLVGSWRTNKHELNAITHWSDHEKLVS